MNTAFFKPWIGKNYFLGSNEKKILVLGESHYCGEGCPTCGELFETKCHGFTNNVMKKYLDYKLGKGNVEDWMKTFTRFVNIFYGDQVDVEKILSFWDSVIFYNYVQIAMEDARISPSENNFNNSETAFKEILEEYEPDLIIVWGDRLWEKLPAGGYWGTEIVDGKSGKLYYYKTSKKNIPAFCIYHPSSSALTYEWAEYFQNVMKLI